jgi:gluconate 2-dehydrogenase gamma chain
MSFFTAEEATTLDAWLECLIPADDDPGAKDAGVIHYIDRQLCRKFRRQQQAYRDGLAAVDAHARRTYSRPFASLENEKQVRMLESMEAGQGPTDLWPDGGKALFEMVLAHAIQGFYGPPRHGGNRDYVSWRMLGIPPMPVRGRLHYDIKDSWPEKS